jgi:hypothetical protein
MKTYANITNGLAYPHDDVCHFMSTHGHNCKMGYYRLDSMPYSAVIELLNGRPIKVVDGTAHDKPLTDGLKFGLTTWAITYNRALRVSVKAAPWQTKEMWTNAYRSSTSKKVVQRIRRLLNVFGGKSALPAILGQSIVVECHRGIGHDDKPEKVPCAN